MNNDPKPLDEDTPIDSTPAFDNSSMGFIEEDHSGRTFIWMLLGVAAIGCGLLFAAALFFFKPDAQSLVDKYFPSPTATFTRTPTVTPTLTPTSTLPPTPTLNMTATAAAAQATDTA